MMKLTNRNIPLSRLKLSAANVRTVSADPEDDKELQASILSLGVLESLLVVPNGDDNFDVVAGGRRLAALQQLAEAGKIAADYVAPCRVLGAGADPAEVSLHENEKRAPMHPADQYEAYERLRAKGMTAADIASRAGVSERQVTKMMRLGTVAPELLAAFRNGEMNLQTLMAFTVTDDRQAQLDVWAKARSGGATWPEHIRDQLTEGAVIGSSGLASFVGLEAYEKAGGRVQRDLFSQFDDEAVYLLDRGLLMKLAEAELKKTADRLAKRWKWVEIQIEADWERIHTLHQLRGEPGTPTAAERKRLDQLADRMQDIADNPPMDPAEQGNAYARSQELNAKHEKLEARIAARTKYRPEDMRIAGCIVTLRGARADVITGLVLPEDVPPKPKKTARKKDAADAPANAPEADGANPAEGGEEPAAPPPSFDERFEEPWTTRTTRNHQSPEAAHAKAAGLSAAVIDDLAAIRTGIVRAALAKRFDVAFDLAAYLLVMDTSTRGTERPADIRLVRTSLRPMGRNGESDFAAASPGEKLDSPPTGQWMKLGDDLKRFDSFRALPDAEKQDLFARAVSAALHNQAANQHRALPVGERVVELLDIDFATAVRPSEKYFWKRLTRARMLEIAEAVVGTEWAKARRNHKKGQLAADMAAVFGDDPQGRAALDAAARERVEQWAMPGFGAWDGPAAKKGRS
ncbi:MAG: ParB N-terminal domain-containing protein [Acidobacteria bacterium]|nr:ParB N-terminal domain-containing protein [Acidobacteriota bacterium]